MQLWVAATLIAALFQTWRTALQQKLRGQMSVNAAAVVRYLYGVPVGLLLTGLYLLIFGGTLCAPTPVFFLYAALGGLGQIIGTNLLIMSFAHRGFAVGTAYAKTEAVQAAFLALLLLGENFSPLAWLGIAVSVGGTLYLSLAGRVGSFGEMLRATVQPAALCGLGAGTGCLFESGPGLDGSTTQFWWHVRGGVRHIWIHLGANVPGPQPGTGS
jgi:multidrug transporter EmrE-like cation transporter